MVCGVKKKIYVRQHIYKENFILMCNNLGNISIFKSKFHLQKVVSATFVQFNILKSLSMIFSKVVFFLVKVMQTLWHIMSVFNFLSNFEPYSHREGFYLLFSSILCMFWMGNKIGLFQLRPVLLQPFSVLKVEIPLL